MREHRGFTLIELIVVAIIVSGATAILVDTFRSPNNAPTAWV